MSEVKRVAFTLHVFHHDHAVSAVGHRRASHYFDRLSGRDCGWTYLAGANQANHRNRQAGRKIGGPAGEPVARGAGKWRLIPIGIHRLGEDHAKAIEKRTEMRRMPRRSGQTIGMLPNDPAGVGKADHARWSGVVQECTKRRDAVGRRPVHNFQPMISVWPSTWC